MLLRLLLLAFSLAAGHLNPASVLFGGLEEAGEADVMGSVWTGFLVGRGITSIVSSALGSGSMPTLSSSSGSDIMSKLLSVGVGMGMMSTVSSDAITVWIGRMPIVPSDTVDCPGVEA